MKLSFVYFSALAMLLMLCSCGKKSEVKDKDQKETLAQTEGHIHFQALKGIKRAVNDNDPDALKKVLSENPRIDLDQIQLETGETFLTTAIKNDFRKIRNLLIEEGASLEKANTNKETPLIAAVTTGRFNSVKVLLELKVHLEKTDTRGNTALHLAIKRRDDAISVLLINHGANIYALDDSGKNALILAKDYGLRETLENVKSIMDMDKGAPDITSFRSILEKGDNQRLKKVLDKYPRLAVEKTYQAINPLAILVDAPNEIGALKSAELLIQRETKIDGPENAEETPLIKATRSLKKSFADLYLASKANPQLFDKDGKSALIHAIELNHVELVDLLLGRRAMVKYTYPSEDGVEMSFSACATARKVARKLRTPEEKAISKDIRRKLRCFNRLF